MAKDSQTKQRKYLRWYGRQQELGIPLERHQRLKHWPMCRELYRFSPLVRGRANLLPSFKNCPQIEIVNVRDFLLDHKDQLKFSMNLHSYGEMVLLPWGYTYERPDNIDQLIEVRSYNF